MTTEEMSLIIEEYKQAIQEIPVFEGEFSITDGNDCFSREEVANASFAITYEVFEADDNPDIWYWISILFNKDGSISTGSLSNYSTSEPTSFVGVINSRLEKFGFETISNMGDVTKPVKELRSWQDAYDFLCSISKSLFNIQKINN